MKARQRPGGARGSVNSDLDEDVGAGIPAAKVAGQPIQFSTKDRTQCMENDRFMITKRVNIDQLPDPKK